jgi:hypothetical protein
MDEDLEVDDGSMAAAMGFASFGGASRPAKKRRFDAVIAGQNPKPVAEHRTGANSVPVRASGASSGAITGDRQTVAEDKDRQAINPSKAERDPNELVLDEEDGADDEDGTKDGERAIGDGRTAPGTAAQAEDEDDDPEPQYIDTSRPSTELSTRDDAQFGLPSQLVALEDTTPPFAQRGNFHGGRGRGRGAYRGGLHGGSAPGTPWWTDYLDPSFNQNPWERLERNLGLDARGSWVPRGGG